MATSSSSPPSPPSATPSSSTTARATGASSRPSSTRPDRLRGHAVTRLMWPRDRGFLSRPLRVSPFNRRAVMRKILFLLAMLVPAALQAHSSDFNLSVVVDGSARPEYAAGGTTYIEALRGRNYTLRVTNPTPHRVAVALSVDGLNTIDARHTDGWNATKWVIEPYGSIDIDGWQVSDSTARRFVFTGERRSYGAALGQTENLGVIEAIFYRERTARLYEAPQRYKDEERSAAGAEPRTSASAPPDDDYAATGMGGRT